MIEGLLKSYFLKVRQWKSLSLTPSSPSIFSRDSVVLFYVIVMLVPCEVGRHHYLHFPAQETGVGDIKWPIRGYTDGWWQGEVYTSPETKKPVVFPLQCVPCSHLKCSLSLWIKMLDILSFRFGKPLKNSFCVPDAVLHTSCRRCRLFPTIFPLGICTFAFILQVRKPRLRKWNDLPKDPGCEEKLSREIPNHSMLHLWWRVMYGASCFNTWLLGLLQRADLRLLPGKTGRLPSGIGEVMF